MARNRIRFAVVGVGNCASALVQGIHHYGTNPPIGLMHPVLGGYEITDLVPVMAFDIDVRKVGRDLSEAIFVLPNCTKRFSDVPPLRAPVYMGPIADGVSPVMLRHPRTDQSFLVANHAPVDPATVLRRHRVQVLVNYLPVGSVQATSIYAQAALQARCAFVNCIPSFIASDPAWAQRFKEAGLPLLGDDVKSQLGATYIHRALVQAALDRGIHIDTTSQHNQGGNTDFLNMTDESRLQHKLASKSSSIETLFPAGHPLPTGGYFGPGEVQGATGRLGHGWRDGQNDTKTATIILEGRMWGGVTGTYRVDLRVEDSPDSAGCVADAIRCAKLAFDRGLAGAIDDACTFFFKHPPKPASDHEARTRLSRFIGADPPRTRGLVSVSPR